MGIEHDQAEKHKYIDLLSFIFRVSILVGFLFMWLTLYSIIIEGFLIIKGWDVLFNLLFVLLGYINYRFLEKRDEKVIAGTSLTMVTSLVYSFIVRRGLHLITLVIFGIVLLVLISLRKQGVLKSQPSPSQSRVSQIDE